MKLFASLTPGIVGGLGPASDVRVFFDEATARAFAEDSGRPVMVVETEDESRESERLTEIVGLIHRLHFMNMWIHTQGKDLRKILAIAEDKPRAAVPREGER